MKNYNLNNVIVLAITAFVSTSCTETYPLLTNTYEEALVVEATITNELKNQEITITKTAKFEDKSYLPESDAEVFITDDAGNQYNFTEDAEKYVSTIAFQAVPDRKYQLHIITKDGRSFESSQELLTTISPLQNVNAVVENDDKNLRGVAIKVNSFDAGNTSKYYRYEYEETYKIVAPKWTSTKVVSYQNNSYVFADNSKDTRICYGNKKSTELILTQTNKLNEDRVDNFVIRFISDQDYIITTRYSILVKQYIESLGAFTYYKTLKDMSDSESVLNPKQPGILLGNLKSVNNSNSKITGYFDVASVSTERIYFNYNDLFPGAAPPPYYTDCTDYCYSSFPSVPIPCTHDINGFDTDFELKNITFFVDRFDLGYLFWVDAPCGDCTSFSSNIKPTFWKD